MCIFTPDEQAQRQGDGSSNNSSATTTTNNSNNIVPENRRGDPDPFRTSTPSSIPRKPAVVGGRRYGDLGYGDRGYGNRGYVDSYADSYLDSGGGLHDGGDGRRQDDGGGFERGGRYGLGGREKEDIGSGQTYVTGVTAQAGYLRRGHNDHVNDHYNDHDNDHGNDHDDVHDAGFAGCCDETAAVTEAMTATPRAESAARLSSTAGFARDRTAAFRDCEESAGPAWRREEEAYHPRRSGSGAGYGGGELT